MGTSARRHLAAIASLGLSSPLTASNGQALPKCKGTGNSVIGSMTAPRVVAQAPGHHLKPPETESVSVSGLMTPVQFLAILSKPAH
jgi:hypothetical protein